MSALPPRPSSSRTLTIALLANVTVAVEKTTAAVVTALTAMAAKAAHACADVGNQLLLVVAQRRSVRPADDRHPFGYGREAYFLALIVRFPGIIAVEELLVTFIGPRQVWVLCRVDIDDNLRCDQVELLVGEVERMLRGQSAYVFRVDIVPIGHR
jgi:divalent metal cation (Fe/Co/Zn/Cd) transporter